MKRRKVLWSLWVFYALFLLFAACEQPSGDTPLKQELEQEEEQEEEEEEEQQQQQNPAAKLTGIIIGSPPETLFYALDQIFDPAGLIVEGEYDDDTSRTLTTGEYTLGAVDTARSGPQRVTVKAGTHTASFPIMVNNSDSVLQSIAINAPAEGLVRYLGQVLGTEGFTVTGHYTEGGRDLSAFSVRGYDRTKRGPQTVTLSVNGKSALLPVTVLVPAGAVVGPAVLGTDSSNPRMGHNNVFIKGQSLALANTRFYASVSANNVTTRFISGDGINPEDISGFDPGQEGKQTITLNLDDKAIPLTVYVADREPEVYFDYGFMRTAADPDGWGITSGRTEGCYHTQPGKKVVLSPVRALIGYDRDNNDLGVTYAWTVTPRNGSPPLTPPSVNGEFLALTPAAGGTWDVSVTVTGRNFIDGSTISVSAATALICDTGPLTPRFYSPVTRNFAPGQFTESGTGHGWSLGTFGGYLMKPASHKAQYTIEGNGFDGWAEPGVVWFQEDHNENGRPDEMWYELNVGDAPHITRRYSLKFFKYGDGSSTNEYGQIIREIYWADGKGRTGQINGGWPKDWGVSNADGAWVTYTGTLIFDTGDIKSDSYLPTWPNCVDTAQQVFPISGAVAADNSPVDLTKVGFVKVHTGVFKYGGLFGEVSTEITNSVAQW